MSSDLLPALRAIAAAVPSSDMSDRECAAMLVGLTRDRGVDDDLRSTLLDALESTLKRMPLDLLSPNDIVELLAIATTIVERLASREAPTWRRPVDVLRPGAKPKLSVVR